MGARFVTSERREEHDLCPPLTPCPPWCFQARRYAEFTELKRRIAALMAALDRVPESSFEKDAACEDEDAFCLSRDNIAALELLAAQVRCAAAEPRPQRHGPTRRDEN